jgi:hypothetical protein
MAVLNQEKRLFLMKSDAMQPFFVNVGISYSISIIYNVDNILAPLRGCQILRSSRYSHNHNHHH